MLDNELKAKEINFLKGRIEDIKGDFLREGEGCFDFDPDFKKKAKNGNSVFSSCFEENYEDRERDCGNLNGVSFLDFFFI